VTRSFYARLALASLVCIPFIFVSRGVAENRQTVTAHAQIVNKGIATTEKSKPHPHEASEVVVWLTPLDRHAGDTVAAVQSDKRPQLVQKNKAFHPHLLVTRVGSMVDFPNRDPFFHNVFSLFDGKRFDLGLYEAGATNSVRFDRPGVSFLFCNIHPEMSAVVVALDTPYYGVSDKSGNVSIANVPDGRYEMHIWYERSLPEDLRGVTKTVRVGSDARDLGAIAVPENPSFSPAHKNKYGQDYAPPPTPTYSHP
jgi:plastocyanin